MRLRHHFEVVNPAAITHTASAAASCGEYQDAPVCKNGESDVTCSTEKYRGCAPGETDCADSGTNNDDRCCAGSSRHGPGDNIDHQYCSTSDAEWGGFADPWCLIGLTSDGNKPRI